MEKIIQQVQEWGFIAKLPKEFVGFTLMIELQVQDTQYCIFTY